MKFVLRVFTGAEGTDREIVDLEWQHRDTKDRLRAIAGDRLELWWIYAKAEKKDFDRYQLFELTLSQVVEVSNRDRDKFEADTRGEKSPAGFVPSKIVASSIKRNESSISGYGGFTSEIITSTYVESLLSEQGFSGLSFDDIEKHDGSTQHIYRRMSSGSVLRSDIVDFSTPRRIDGIEAALFGRPGVDYHRYWGCKTLEDEELGKAQDFNRLATLDDTDGYLGWAVSSRAYTCLKKQKIRGFKCLPVLRRHSSEYGAYEADWRAIVEFLVKCRAVYLGREISSYFNIGFA